jgi:Domain of unknown function (DUF3368)
MSDYLGLSYFLFAVSPNPMKISVVSDPLDGTSAKPLLDALISEAGFWVAEPLYTSVLQLVNEIDLP